jgi:hypothetical protein
MNDTVLLKTALQYKYHARERLEDQKEDRPTNIAPS